MNRRTETAQTTPMPPSELRPVTCRCRAKYLDTVGGRQAHETVFGHGPKKEGE